MCPTVAEYAARPNHIHFHRIKVHMLCPWAETHFVRGFFPRTKGFITLKQHLPYQKYAWDQRAYVSERDSTPAHQDPHQGLHHFTMFLFVSTLRIARKTKEYISWSFSICSRLNCTLSTSTRSALRYLISFYFS